jgi:tetrahydromethanopterin S-methyltransferase subunit C
VLNAGQPAQALTVAALICGILGILGGFIPGLRYFTGILAVLALVFGAGERKAALAAGRPAGTATAGMVLGIIGIALTLAAILISTFFAGALLYWAYSLFG